MTQKLVVSIKPAQEVNADILANISKKAFHTDAELGNLRTLSGTPKPGGPPGYDSPKFQKFIMNIMNYYEILAEDKIVGGLFFSSANQDHYVVERIFILPSYHRKGIATRAMELVFEKHPEAKFWTLGTPNWNLRTQPFYEKLGYVHVGWEETEDPEWRGVWYQKTIKPYILPKIKNLKKIKGLITVEGIISRVGSTRKTIQKNQTESEIVADAILKDDTGEINIIIKGFQITYMKPGTKVRVEYATVESYSGKLTLDWKYGRIINLL